MDRSTEAQETLDAPERSCATKDVGSANIRLAVEQLQSLLRKSLLEGAAATCVQEVIQLLQAENEEGLQAPDVDILHELASFMEDGASTSGSTTTTTEGHHHHHQKTLAFQDHLEAVQSRTGSQHVSPTSPRPLPTPPLVELSSKGRRLQARTPRASREARASREVRASREARASRDSMRFGRASNEPSPSGSFHVTSAATSPSSFRMAGSFLVSTQEHAQEGSETTTPPFGPKIDGLNAKQESPHSHRSPKIFHSAREALLGSQHGSPHFARTPPAKININGITHQVLNAAQSQDSEVYAAGGRRPRPPHAPPRSPAAALPGASPASPPVAALPPALPQVAAPASPPAAAHEATEPAKLHAKLLDDHGPLDASFDTATTDAIMPETRALDFF